MSEKGRSFFISHSFSDREFAQQLATSIIKLGGKTSLSGHGTIAEGSVWLDGLRERLRASDAVILVMPSQSAKSANSTFFEAGAARALGKEVIVVVPDIQNVDQANIPFEVASSVVLDATRKSIDSIAQKVMEAA